MNAMTQLDPRVVKYVRCTSQHGKVMLRTISPFRPPCSSPFANRLHSRTLRRILSSSYRAASMAPSVVTDNAEPAQLVQQLNEQYEKVSICGSSQASAI